MQVYCNDLYDLNETNTELFNEHKEWYNDFKATSVGDLIDKQQDMIDSYRKAVDNSTQEIGDLQVLVRQGNKVIEAAKEEIDALRLQITSLKAVINKEATTENMIGQL